MIQINRPRNWKRENILQLIKELIDVERYNAFMNRSINKFKEKWKSFEHIQ